MKNRFFVFVIILFAVVFGGWIYALDTMEGNYLNFKISTKISRTRDGKNYYNDVWAMSRKTE